MTNTEISTTGTTKTIRKRKTHNKSRHGCGNCKLRRVKCDEGKPCCKRCLNFGVACSYDGKTTLESTMEGTFSVDIPVNTSFNERVLNFITSPQPTSSNSSEESEFDAEDYAALERFRTRTVFSIGTEKSQEVYKRVIPPLALEHPFLMHLLVTLVLMHDRFLTDAKLEESSAQSEPEAYHWYQGTVMFNKKLRELYSPMSSSERDAMWGAAVSLGCIAFFCIEGDTPQQVWPLKPPGPLDLDWLKISDGKKEVWRVANPLRPESCFGSLAHEQVNMLANPLEEPPLPEGFKELWGQRPYERAAGIVGQVLHMECNQQTILVFLGFIARVESDFLKALVDRDPKAMLLLGVWYAKLCPYRKWWTMRRAVLESQAICLYLQEHHSDFVTGIGKHLFEFVRTECGLIRGWGWRDFAREAGFGDDTGKEGFCKWRGDRPLFIASQRVTSYHTHLPQPVERQR